MSTISAGNTTTTSFKVTADTNADLVFTTGGSNATALTLSNTQVATFAQTINTPNTFGFKNRFINGNMVIAQRSSSANVTAGNAVPTSSTGYPCVDRWFVYSAGANVSVARVAGSGNNQNNLQITGAANVTAIGVGQRIENVNSYDMAGQTVTLSVGMSNSLLSNVTWTASYANTTNSFGTIGTPTKVQIATGTFVVNSTFSLYSTQISVPSNATTGVEILFTVGAQTSGTWVIGNAQLEVGSQATSFDYRSYGTELALCQRYCNVYGGAENFDYFGIGFVTATNGAEFPVIFPVEMRSVPTVSLKASYSFSVNDGVTVTGGTAALTGAVNNTKKIVLMALTSLSASTLTVGRACRVSSNNTTNTQMTFSSEL